MDDILVAAPTPEQVDQLVLDISQTLKSNGFEITDAKIKKGPSVTFLGVKITSSYVTPPAIKIRQDIRTLHDAQQLVGSLQWLRNVILIPPETMSPLYELLKGKHPWEQKVPSEEAAHSLDFIDQQLATAVLFRWNPSLQLDLYVHFTKEGGLGALAQGPPDTARPVQWVVLGKSSCAFAPGVECLGDVIMKGRKLALTHLRFEPARIYLPFRKQISASSVAVSEHLALALFGFAGEPCYAAKPPWSQLLSVVDMDLPPKVMDRPLPGRTVFTDASSTTSTAAVAWQEEEKWQCIKRTDKCLSVQQLEASAIALACSLFQEEHLNIVTDSVCCQALPGDV